MTFTAIKHLTIYVTALEMRAPACYAAIRIGDGPHKIVFTDNQGITFDDLEEDSISIEIIREDSYNAVVTAFGW
jgi:hypothetical protein